MNNKKPPANTSFLKGLLTTLGLGLDILFGKKLCQCRVCAVCGAVRSFLAFSFAHVTHSSFHTLSSFRFGRAAAKLGSSISKGADWQWRKGIWIVAPLVQGHARFEFEVGARCGTTLINLLVWKCFENSSGTLVEFYTRRWVIRLWHSNKIHPTILLLPWNELLMIHRKRVRLSVKSFTNSNRL